MTDDAPGTQAQLRAELQTLRAELQALEGRLNQRHEMLRSEMQHMYDDLKETMRDVQTEILKALYGFSEGVQLRFKESDKIEASLRERITSIEGRLLDVEKRLNMPAQ
jgi:hypothetical protein